ncbi:MAG: acetylxylan esterase, partial [Kiritimatiellae bacterium]|nr:acetylxylan esterase [Kiritimatiellia bacterium]
MNSPLFGNIVNEYYVDKIRAVDAARAKRLRAIRTADDARRYVAALKRKVAKIFPFPARTPLAPVVTTVHDYDGYTVENLYFYSRPNWPVTANFYLPAKRRGKVPGVLIVCGHANEGKACDTYSSAAIGLVLKGFAVLVIDPVEQGERKQYRDVDNPRGGLCANHNMMGKQLAMTGEWLGAWRTWDAVRGLDYLETRPEVDASRLMVTGNSGGGTLTTWVAAADPRPIAVAPSCYVTSWLHNIENELPADIEQMPPRILEFGMEMG